MTHKENFDILEIRDYYPSINNPSSSTWVFNQVSSLSEKGYLPLVISPTPVNPFRRLFKKKFQLYDTPSTTIENYKNTLVIRPPYLKFPRSILIKYNLSNLSRCIEKYGSLKEIKLIHAHFGQNGYSALSLKEKLNVPLITSFYGFDAGPSGNSFHQFYKELSLKGDLFLALSSDMKNDLVKLGFPENKILIHHLGVDTTIFAPIHKENKEKFIFLTVARFEKSKGIHLVIEAFDEFRKEMGFNQNEVELRIVGGGKCESMLKKQADDLKLTNHIIFINNLILPNSREIVINEMKNCDVFVLASYTLNDISKEGTPVVLMEAQSCGKPCISTNHAGIPEIIIDQKTGEIVPEQSVESLTNAMLKLYKSETVYKAYCLNSRKNILENFCHSSQMEELFKIYNQMLTSKN